MNHRIFSDILIIIFSIKVMFIVHHTLNHYEIKFEIYFFQFVDPDQAKMFN